MTTELVPETNAPKLDKVASVTELAPIDRMELVAKTQEIGNPMLEKHLYAKIGSNDTLKILPAIVHFGGYDINKKHKQRLSIVNVSTVSQRMHIIQPQTPFFKIKFNKRGLIAPGMSEDILIEFIPTEWRYFYDCIRVHCEKQNLIIPIHGYPVMNEATIPPRIDYGACELNQKYTRVIPLKCKVPIQFEFEINIIKPEESFHIYPLSGIIPANGAININIEFRPVKLSLVSTVIRINLSQYNFEPLLCEILGSAMPGTTKLKAINELQSKLQFINNNDEEEEEGKEERGRSLITDGSQQFIKRQVREFQLNPQVPQKPKQRKGVGSGNFVDIGGEWLRQKKMARSKAVTSSSNSPRKMPQSSEVIKVDGLTIPPVLESVSSTNYVLTQQPGTLKLNELKQAIQQSKLEKHRKKLLLKSKSLENQNETAVEKILADDANDMIPNNTKTRQVKEMLFLQRMKEIEELERNLEFTSNMERVGEVLLTPEETAAIHSNRVEISNSIKRDERREACHTFETKLLKPIDRRVSSVARDDSSKQLQQSAAHLPSFDVYNNNCWKMKNRVLRRLRLAVSKLIVRLRGQRHLKQLMATLLNFHRVQQPEAQVKGFHQLPRSTVRQYVEEDNQLFNNNMVNSHIEPYVRTDWRVYRDNLLSVTGSSHLEEAQDDDEPGEAQLNSLVLPPYEEQPKVIQHVTYPTYDEADSARSNADALPTTAIKGFQDLTFFKLGRCEESRVRDYHELRKRPVTDYSASCDRPLRRGATDELALPLPSSATAAAGGDAAASVAVPALLTSQVYHSNGDALDSLRQSDSTARMVFELSSITEAAPEHSLHFRVHPLQAQTCLQQQWAASVEQRSLYLSLNQTPSISERYLQSRQHHELYDVAAHTTHTTVAELSEAAAQDVLSESESDGEGDTVAQSDYSAPSLGMAQALFCVSDDDDDDDENDDEEATVDAPTVPFCYHTQLLQAEKNSLRKELAARLDNTLAAVNEVIIKAENKIC